MALIKLGKRGDGKGALYQYESREPPTYGDSVTIEETEYTVSDVQRFISKKRVDVVQIDVQRTQ